MPTLAVGMFCFCPRIPHAHGKRGHGTRHLVKSPVQNDEDNRERSIRCLAQLPGRVTLPPTSRWKTFYLTHLVKPAADRLVYRAILQEKIGRIVELGLGDGSRALRMIDAAARNHERQNIHYIGLDSFEDRSPVDGPGLTLIEAHRSLKQSGAKIKLLPGDPRETLMRSANSLNNIDLLLISAPMDSERLERMWFFVPRMLHERSLVLQEVADAKGEKTFRRIAPTEIARFATITQRRKAA